MDQQWLRYLRYCATELFPQHAFARAWNYKDDLCMLGCAQLFKVTGEAVYRDAMLRCADALVDRQGELRHWHEEEHNLDTISFGKSLLAMYELTQEESYLAAALKVWHHLDSHPRTKTGNYWHKDIYPYQVWLDGLYMGLPFSARCMELTGTDGYADIIRQFENVHELLWVKETGLYLHAWDESRSSEWADPQTGRSPSYWLRAEGWYLMALVDCYEVLSRHMDAERLKALLVEALNGLAPYQDKETGMYLQLIDRADLAQNYPETSGSAMVAYALAKGTRLGMLGPDAARQSEHIMEGIRRRYLTAADGVDTLHGICASAGLGPGPDHRTDRDGTPRYYLSEKQIADNQHGYAACMMACAQIMELKR